MRVTRIITSPRRHQARCCLWSPVFVTMFVWATGRGLLRLAAVIADSGTARNSATGTKSRCQKWRRFSGPVYGLRATGFRPRSSLTWAVFLESSASQQTDDDDDDDDDKAPLLKPLYYDVISTSADVGTAANIQLPGCLSRDSSSSLSPSSTVCVCVRVCVCANEKSAFPSFHA